MTGLVGALACGLVLMACDDGGGTARPDPEGAPRTFMMGTSTLPRELNAEAYAEAFDLAAANGEIVLIQRAPPWEDFLPGAGVSDATAETTASEREAVEDGGLRLFFAIDPTDGASGRDRIAGLPEALGARDFSDADVRQAFLSYAEYVAINYRPAYLALGVEMNLYYRKNEADFADYLSLYAEAYDRVKAASPETLVTSTLQYEDLQGILPTTDRHFADWTLLDAFEDRLDIVAISTYPSFVYGRAADLPENYYSQLRAFTAKPIAIAEMGYSSDVVQEGQNSGTEADQLAYVRRATEDAQRLEMPFIIWFAAWDPSYAEDSGFAVFRHIGLLRADGTEKPAWAAWAEAARRPYEPRD